MTRTLAFRAIDGTPVALRRGVAANAQALHALIAAYAAEGHLLPRSLADLTAHADRFVVGEREGEIVACAELAPLGDRVAEVRSLVVAAPARGAGVARQMIGDLVERGARAGLHRVCAFTHDPSFFVHLGFSIVPHTWVAEKIARDCQSCTQFRQCGQAAVVLRISGASATTPAVQTPLPLVAHVGGRVA